jgi:hypothetical protein
MADALELLAVQQRAAAALLGSQQPAGLLRAAEALAGALNEIHHDAQFWTRLRDKKTASADRRQLSLLVQVDWSVLLEVTGYQPPPPPSLVTEEFAQAAQAAATSESVSDWAVLRERIGWLAEALGADAEEPAPPADRTWWHRFRERIGFGVCVVRRMSMAKVLLETRKQIIEKAASTAIAAALGALTGTVLPTVLADIGGKFAVAALDELQLAWAAEKQKQQTSRVSAIVDGPMLRPEEAGRMQATLELAAKLPPPQAVDHLSRVDQWVATAGAELAIAWGFLAAHTGSNGANLVDQTAINIGRLRLLLARIAEAIHSDDTARIPQFVSDASDAFQSLMNTYHELRRFMQECGLEHRHNFG